MTIGCTLCKNDNGKKKNKYFGGVYCDSCMKRINRAVYAGRMPHYKPGLKKGHTWQSDNDTNKH